MKGYKTLLVIALITTVALTLHLGFAKNETKIYIDGELLECDVPPIIYNKVTLVPMRALFESLGATVEWNKESRSITGYKNGLSVNMKLNEKSAFYNGKEYELLVAPMIIRSRTMIPARFVAEILNYKVEWSPKDSSVYITTNKALNKPEMLGMWVASVVNLDYPSAPTKNEQILKEEALKILNKADDMGLNAVFLQVRPSGDALYKSNIFPWSKYLTGQQGVSPNNNFDPLKFWVDEAHKRNIELHAWINPYRITRKKASEPSHDYNSLARSNPAIQNPDWVIEHSDGNLYFNPGIPEVQQLIIDSCLEIINNYQVDGIHLDDYFYPSKSFNDDTTYYQYNKKFSNKADWRRDNVNTLIKNLGVAIKDTKESIKYGISPFGIWCNKSSTAKGSDTRGMESYVDQYADSRKWVKDEYIDYIIPQIYWHIGFEIADYKKLVNWWSDVAEGTSVDLYIGHAAYRASNSNTDSVWHGDAELKRQLELNSKISNVKGSVFFNYTALNSKNDISTMIKDLYE